MTIMTIGSSDECTRVCECVQINLALKNGQTAQLLLFTVPIICEPLSSQPISLCQDRFRHLKGIDLVQPSEDHFHLEIDILFGLD